MQAVHTEHYCSSPVVKGPMRQSATGTLQMVSAAGWNTAGVMRRNIARQSVGHGSALRGPRQCRHQGHEPLMMASQ